MFEFELIAIAADVMQTIYATVGSVTIPGIIADLFWR